MAITDTNAIPFYSSLMARTTRYCHCGRRGSHGTFLCKVHWAEANPIEAKLQSETKEQAAVKTPKRNGPKKKYRPPSQTKRKRGGFVASGSLARYTESVERANQITAHFVQGGRPDSNHRKH